MLFSLSNDHCFSDDHRLSDDRPTNDRLADDRSSDDRPTIIVSRRLSYDGRVYYRCLGAPG